MKDKPIKRMTIKEFRAIGGLQEINRQVLHPAGMALEIIINEETGEEQFGGVWDYRDDPEGMFYGDDMIDPSKIQTIAELQEKHDAERKKLIGQRIQEKK